MSFSVAHRLPDMRQLMVTEFVTLDGVMEAPGGEPTHPHAGWVQDYFDEELGAYKAQETFDAESLLLGRVTWESFSGAWPTYEGAMADAMNSMPKHVVSSTLQNPGWNSTVIDGSGDVVAAVRALKDGDGGPVLIAGSCRLVHTLMLSGLVDTLRLQLFPVSIGSGLRVFPDDQVKLGFTLANQRTFPKGVLALEFTSTI